MSGSTWRRVRLALKIATDEAVVGDTELHGGGAGVRDDGGAVLLHESEDAEDAAHAALAVAAVDGRAERTDGIPRSRGAGQQRQRGGRRAWRLIVGMDRVAPARLTPVLAEQGAGPGVQEPDGATGPLDGHPAAEPARRR